MKCADRESHKFIHNEILMSANGIDRSATIP
jgi:hypothetical protein